MNEKGTRHRRRRRRGPSRSRSHPISSFFFPLLLLSPTHSQGPTATLGIYVDSGSVYETAETTGTIVLSVRETGREKEANCSMGARPCLFFLFSTSTSPRLTLNNNNKTQARPTSSSTWPSRPRSTGRTSGWCAR